MGRKASRAGKEAATVAIVYCPSCGAELTRQTAIRYRAGDEVLCTVCGAHYQRPALSRSRVKLEVPRVITALVYLTRTYGNTTRAELARHLNVTNSPRLRGLLDGLAMRGLVAVEVKPHPQNSRPCYFYSKTPVLQTTRPAVRPRAFSAAGATR
jgi:predicted RNA-binding Zn-ribbon protein involved in translation (DUF1610 family)